MESKVKIEGDPALVEFITAIRETLVPVLEATDVYSIDLEVKQTKDGRLKVNLKAEPII